MSSIEMLNFPTFGLLVLTKKQIHKKFCGINPIHVSALLFLVATTSCHGRKPQPFMSDLKMSDQRAERQLIAGFYGVEQNKWRWVAHRFAVVLSPLSCEQKESMLRLQMYIPDLSIERLGPMVLTADIGDRSMKPHKFIKGGLVEYSHPVLPEVLNTNLLPVVFTFDKFIPPLISDSRELAAVVLEVSLECHN